jgi:hypothetical protein
MNIIHSGPPDCSGPAGLIRVRSPGRVSVSGRAIVERSGCMHDEIVGQSVHRSGVLGRQSSSTLRSPCIEWPNTGGGPISPRRHVRRSGSRTRTSLCGSPFVRGSDRCLGKRFRLRCFIASATLFCWRSLTCGGKQPGVDPGRWRTTGEQRRMPPGHLWQYDGGGEDSALTMPGRNDTPPPPLAVASHELRVFSTGTARLRMVTHQMDERRPVGRY